MFLTSTFVVQHNVLQWPPIHPFTHTLEAAAMQGAVRPIGSNLEFSVFTKGTSIYGQLELGFEPPTPHYWTTTYYMEKKSILYIFLHNKFACE